MVLLTIYMAQNQEDKLPQLGSNVYFHFQLLFYKRLISVTDKHTLLHKKLSCGLLFKDTSLFEVLLFTK